VPPSECTFTICINIDVNIDINMYCMYCLLRHFQEFLNFEGGRF